MFRTLIRVAMLAIIWSLWLYRKDKVFNGKKISLAGHLSVYRYAVAELEQKNGGAKVKTDMSFFLERQIIQQQQAGIKILRNLYD
jgi:hypothetical protein